MSDRCFYDRKRHRIELKLIFLATHRFTKRELEEIRAADALCEKTDIEWRISRPTLQIEQVLEAMRYGCSSFYSIAQVTGISVRIVSAWLSVLRKAGKIRVVDEFRVHGSQPTKFYEIVN